MGRRELLSVIRYAQGQQPSEAPKCPLERPQRALREPKRCQNGSRSVAERFQEEPKSVQTENENQKSQKEPNQDD